MTITIHIKDPESIESVKAVGARDLLEFFFPQYMGVKASSIRVHERTSENTAKLKRGEEYSYYEDTYTKEEEA
jgi:hypothetical protein